MVENSEFGPIFLFLKNKIYGDNPLKTKMVETHCVAFFLSRLNVKTHWKVLNYYYSCKKQHPIITIKKLNCICKLNPVLGNYPNSFIVNNEPYKEFWK